MSILSVLEMVCRDLTAFPLRDIPSVGQLGYLERENASILNASITTYAQYTIRAFQQAMKRLGLDCPLYITQVLPVCLNDSF